MSESLSMDIFVCASVGVKNGNLVFF